MKKILLMCLLLLFGCTNNNKPEVIEEREYTLISPEMKLTDGSTQVAIYSKRGVPTNEWVYICANSLAVKQHNAVPIYVKVRP